MSVQEVIDRLRSNAEEEENIYSVYVVGERRVLEGVVPLRSLLVSPPDTKVADIMSTEVFTAGPDDDQEQVADIMSKYDLLAVPVVDESGRLLGMVTVDDALDVMEQEAAEDLELATGSAQGAAGAWLSLRRTGSWAIAWAVIAFALAAIVRTNAASTGVSGALPWIVVATVLLPIVLRLTEDLASRANAGLIEGPGEQGRPQLGRRLLTDGLVGLVLGAISGIAVLALVDVALHSIAKAALFAVPTGLTVFVTTIVATLVASAAERACDSGRRVSQTALTGGLLLLAAVVYVSLASLASLFAAGAFPGLLG
jgi:magnesium transporter